MLPAGHVTEETVTALGGLLGAGDIVIDGGNSYFRDDIRRAEALAPKGMRYLDVGTSGGVWGLERGYCMMIGGERAAFEHLDPIFAALAPGIGRHSAHARAGRTRDAPRRAGLHPRGPDRRRAFREDDPQRHRVRHDAGDRRGLRHPAQPGEGAVPAARALRPRHGRHRGGLAARQRGEVLAARPDGGGARRAMRTLEHFSGYVEDSGEGRWTIEAAMEEAVPAEVLAAALFTRFRSRQEHTFAEKMLSAMRLGFGGHIEQGHT